MVCLKGADTEGSREQALPATLRRGDPACGVSADTLKVHLYKYKARRVRARERPTAATLCRGSRRETAIQRSIRRSAEGAPLAGFRRIP